MGELGFFLLRFHIDYLIQSTKSNYFTSHLVCSNLNNNHDLYKEGIEALGTGFLS
jgi:hypothetical protein